MIIVIHNHDNKNDNGSNENDDNKSKNDNSNARYCLQHSFKIIRFNKIIIKITITIIITLSNNDNDDNSIIIIIITKPKPAYGRQGLAGSWGQDTDEVSTFLVFLTSHFAPAALSFKPTWDH